MVGVQFNTCLDRLFLEENICILYSYNTGTRDMTEIYARLPRARIPSKHVISVMFHTLEVKSIVSIIVKL